MDLRLLCVPYLAHDDHQNLSSLLRLHEPGNNCVNFIEYLLPAHLGRQYVADYIRADSLPCGREAFKGESSKVLFFGFDVPPGDPLIAQT
jgi:hypothetical protein